MNGKHIEELTRQAEAFIRQCYAELDKSEAETDHRILAVHEEINQSGSYTHTTEELAHGARITFTP